jgi:adenine-specific DNA-methyltransferase
MDRMLELTTTAHDDAIVLDFFAGSGTMGEAVLRRNARDGGRRRLVLVQLDEPLDDLAHPTISALTRARVRAVDADVGDTLAQRSAGFRAYRLDTAALRSKPTIEEEQRADRLFLDEINPSRSDEDLLTEVLLARGFDLTEQVAWREVADAQVADVADGALLVCLTREMTNERFEALVNLEPAQLILLEAGFGGDDEVKVNALQHLKTANAHRQTPIELLVV